jgi:hypothetical protein
MKLSHVWCIKLPFAFVTKYAVYFGYKLLEINWLSKLKKGRLHSSILYAVGNNLAFVYFLWECTLAHNVSILSSFDSVLITIATHCVHFIYFFFTSFCSLDLESPISVRLRVDPLFWNCVSFFICPHFQSSSIYTASNLLLFLRQANHVTYKN